MQFAITSIYLIYLIWFNIIFYDHFAVCVKFIYIHLRPLMAFVFMYNQHTSSTLGSTCCQDFPTNTHTDALCFLYGTQHYWCLVMLLWSIYAENLGIVENLGCRCPKSFIIIFIIFFCQVSLNFPFLPWFAWADLVEMLLLRYFYFWLIEWVFGFGVGIVGLITATFVYVKWGIC